MRQSLYIHNLFGGAKKNRGGETLGQGRPMKLPHRFRGRFLDSNGTTKAEWHGLVKSATAEQIRDLFFSAHAPLT